MPSKAKGKSADQASATLRDFARRFGLRMDQANARKWFVNRVRNLVLHSQALAATEDDYALDRYAWGLSNYLGRPYYTWKHMNDYLPESFDDLLPALEWLVDELPGTRGGILSRWIAEALREAPADLGVEWTGRYFTPTGAPVLDAALVKEPLDWLQQRGYEGAAEAFDRALGALLRARKDRKAGRQAISSAYEALESAAKKALGNRKDLSANRELLVSRLSLGGRFAGLLAPYIAEANPYRHGDAEPVPDPPYELAEGFVYEAGMMLRAIVTRSEETQPKSTSAGRKGATTSRVRSISRRKTGDQDS